MSVSSEEGEASDSASTRNNSTKGISLFEYFASQIQRYIVGFRERKVMNRIELSTILREVSVSFPSDFTAMARAARCSSPRK